MAGTSDDTCELSPVCDKFGNWTAPQGSSSTCNEGNIR